jgi:folate-binding protein YgfZ
MMTDLFDGLDGAVTDTDGALLHAGNPFAEQRALADGTAVAILLDRAAVSVSGPDRLSWLDSVSSQALTQLEPGISTELLILDPNGRVEHAAAVVDDGETTWLITDRGDAEPLLTWLLRMRFRLRVELRAADDLFIVGASDAALEAVTAAAPAGVPLIWRDPWPHVGPGGAAYAVPEEHPGLDRSWNEVLVTAGTVRALVSGAGAGGPMIAGSLAADALRVAAWRPRWAREADERLIPHEVDWLRTAVHLNKGCYRGQETVAKVHNLGHPPRRLVALHLDGSDAVLPEPGDPVTVDGTTVGSVTSVARHYEDGPIALALIKRSAPADAAYLVETADGPIAAAAQIVVPADAGATASIPKITRLSRRV